MISCGLLPPEPQHLWDTPWSKGGVLCPALAASTELLSSKLPSLSCGIAQPEEISSRLDQHLVLSAGQEVGGRTQG